MMWWYLFVVSCVGMASLLDSLSLIPRKVVDVINLSGRCIDYRQAWAWQNRLVDRHVSKQTLPTAGGYVVSTGSLLVLQHKSVYTLGSGTKESSGPFGITGSDGHPLVYESVQVDRAGEATYHALKAYDDRHSFIHEHVYTMITAGPGQVVLYPIMDLSYYGRDINWYLRKLECVVIKAMLPFGINASRIEVPGYTGVWVDDRYKIAAIGLKIRRWVTMHGVSINVHPDMRYFENIVPCGITDKEVGSIKQLLVGAHVHIHADDDDDDDGSSSAAAAAIDDVDDDDTLYRAVVRELIRCFLEEFDCDVDTLLADEQALSYLDQLQGTAAAAVVYDGI